MTYIGGVAGAVLGLLLRSALLPRIAEPTVFKLQIGMFLAGIGIGGVLDVREVMRKRRR